MNPTLDTQILTLRKYQVRDEPVAWYTEDHLTDKSATTWNMDTANKWKVKGWPVYPLYTAPQIPEGYKLVPIEPTAVMRVSAVQATRCMCDTDHLCGIYKAMLETAPEVKP